MPLALSSGWRLEPLHLVKKASSTGFCTSGSALGGASAPSEAETRVLPSDVVAFCNPVTEVGDMGCSHCEGVSPRVGSNSWDLEPTLRSPSP